MTTALHEQELAHEAEPDRTVLTPWPRRIVNIVRLQFANPWNPVIIPVMILLFIFAVNYAIWAMVDRFSDGAWNDGEIDPATGEVMFEANFNNGGVGFLLIYMLVVAVQTMHFTFSYAMGYGITRRDYYMGTVAFFTTLSVGYSALVTVMAAIEEATNGWGYRAQFFSMEYAGIDAGLQTFVFFVMAFLFFMFVGAAVATVYVRWRASGMLVFWASVVVLLVAAVWFTFERDAWPTVGRAIADAGTFGVAVWTLPVSALAALGGYLILRRATPRN